MIPSKKSIGMQMLFKRSLHESTRSAMAAECVLSTVIRFPSYSQLLTTNMTANMRTITSDDDDDVKNDEATTKTNRMATTTTPTAATTRSQKTTGITTTETHEIPIRV